MNKSKEFESKRNQFVTLLSQLDASMVDYVGALKKKSSEELLNGSTSVAKKYLEEVLLLESNTTEFARLIENIVNFIHKSGGSVSDINESKKTSNNFTKDPIIKKLVVKEPVVKEPVVKEPVVKEPVVREPVAKDPVIKDPVSSNSAYISDNVDLIEDQNKFLEEQIKKIEIQDEKIEEQVQIIKKKPVVYDPKIPILKSLIYLGGIANEEEIIKYMKQYNGRNGDKNISIDELKVSLDLMYGNEMISVDPLDENIEILQSGIDYLAYNEV